MAASPEDLTHLVAALKAGDRDAYRELVHHMGEPLLRYAAKIIGDHDLAHDVVQDAFMRIYRLRRKLDQHQEFRGLCFRITRNLARNAIRDASLRRQREQEASEMRGGEDTKTQALAKSAWEQVDKLPGALREVLELRFAFGLNRTEVAAALEIPEGTVATRQRKGIEQVRNQMSVGAPALAALLAASQPSTPTPDLFYLEELVMNGIRSMKVKAVGMVATASLVVLLLLIGAGVTVNALVSHDPPPRDLIAQANNSSHNAPGARPGTAGVTSANKNVANDRTPQPDVQPENEPDAPTQPAPQPEPEPETNPEPETPVQPTPQPALEQPEAEVVQVAPRFESAPVTRAVVGIEYVYVIKVEATPGAHIAADRMPAWLQLKDNMLRGTPAVGVAGVTVPVTLTASNGIAPDAIQAFEITVDSPPVITSTPVERATAGEGYEYEITAKGSPAPTLSVKNAPGWLKLEGNTLSGEPANADGGITEEITLTASNGIKPDAAQTFKIVVTSPPGFTSLPVTTIKAGEFYSYKIETSGYPFPKIKTKKLPKWLKYEDGILKGTPRNADIGEDKVKLEADNGIKPKAKQDFKIEIEENPAYIEMPWGLEEAKAYFKPGLKFTVTEWGWGRSFSKEFGWDPNTRNPKEYEVTETTPTGYKFKLQRYDVDTSAGKAVLKPLPIVESELGYADTGYMLYWHFLHTEWTRLPDEEEKIDIDGKKYDAVVFTWENPRASSGGYKERYSYSFLKDKPLLARTHKYKVDDKGTIQWFDRKQELITSIEEP